MRSRGDGTAMVNTGCPVQIEWHAERRDGSVPGLVGRQRLFFGSSFRLHCRLKGLAFVFVRFVGARWLLCLRSGSCPGFKREYELPDFDFFSLRYQNVFHNSAQRRWDLHHGLVGLNFHDGLAFGDLCAWGNHQANQIALMHVLAEFRQLEFSNFGRL